MTKIVSENIQPIFRIDINSLETVGTRDVKQYIGVVNHTSHPHIMNDGTVIPHT